MRIFAIGDVHGCLDSLKEMYGWIQETIEPGDEIVFLGDYIDRGPDSKRVVDFLIDKRQTSTNRIVCLLGNHEEMMLDALAHPNPQEFNGWALMMGRQTMDSYRNAGFSNIPADHLEFYKSLTLYYTKGKYVFVHAGIDPNLPLDVQTKNTMIWTRRYDGYNGDYNGGYTVIRGHTPKERIVVTRNQINIDTGAVFGGVLTCVILDTENDSQQFYQVKGYQRSE